MKFGNFDFPERGENLLAIIDFTPQQLYSVGKPMEEVFWLPIDPKLFNIASELQVRIIIIPRSLFIAYVC